MANINTIIKGLSDIILTREYNRESSSFNTDHVGFNNTANEFNSYLLNSTCGIPATDKIKIKSLPSQGRLFYRVNPNVLPANFDNCFVGQEILVSDLLINKVLKFSALIPIDPNVSPVYTYLTEFNIERFCGSVSTNQIIKVKLNMIEI